jgi:hypothetical protein
MGSRHFAPDYRGFRCLASRHSVNNGQAGNLQQAAQSDDGNSGRFPPELRYEPGKSSQLRESIREIHTVRRGATDFLDSSDTMRLIF